MIIALDINWSKRNEPQYLSIYPRVIRNTEDIAMKPSDTNSKEIFWLGHQLLKCKCPATITVTKLFH